jgi:hypothetical protein
MTMLPPTSDKVYVTSKTVVEREEEEEERERGSSIFCVRIFKFFVQWLAKRFI